ncbi:MULTISPECIES: CBASS cGAMP-activated phospholipase [Bradyrhizobium]|uniref:Patatin-like phospholipase/acyl hydrolase n=1 Tax=Bradyrhizobium japonicum TaxID=375 RepID=A0ABV2S6M3_BRAJP|nr:CBASS cGAMP-activated phospholipase [Bradyrhizobium sp. CCBAU 15544]
MALENELATESTKKKPFQILALSGGGYLGLYAAEILARLEERAGRPIGSCFDLIAGTSVGGILAAGVSLDVPAARMRDLFIERGRDIFSGRPRPKFGWIDAGRSVLGPKYDGQALRSVVSEIIGDQTMLAACKHRLIIPAVNMTKGSVQMFKTGHHPDFTLDPKRRLVDVVMATSAAPTYFPLAEVGAAHYADGGLVANAPDQCALHEATHFLKQDVCQISILSIGTTSTGFSLKRSLGRDLGSAKWMMRGRLLRTIVSSQQQLVDYMLRHQLGERYLRIDATQSEEQQADLALDVADANAQGTLLGLAEGSFQKVAADNALQKFLTHKPDPPDFPGVTSA